MVFHDYLVHPAERMLRVQGDFLMLSRVGLFLSALLEKLRNNTGPPRLVTRTDTAAVVSVKVFIEQHEILPGWVVLKFI